MRSMSATSKFYHIWFDTLISQWLISLSQIVTILWCIDWVTHDFQGYMKSLSQIPHHTSIQISYTLWSNIVMENHHSLLCSRRAQCDEVKTPMPELKEHPEGPVIGKRWETGCNIWMNMIITYWIAWNNVVGPCEHSNYSNSSSFTRNWCYKLSVKKWLSLGLPYAVCPSFGENQYA